MKNGATIFIIFLIAGIDCTVNLELMSNEKVFPLIPKKRVPFCPYCVKFHNQFSRHLELKHNDIPKVQKFLSSKTKQLRHSILASIRNEGYGLYYEKTRKVIPVKSIKKGATNVYKIQCLYCKGHFSRDTLNAHHTNCYAKNNECRAEK